MGSGQIQVQREGAAMSDSPQYTPVPPQPAQPQAAQSGLSDTAAGALAYVTIIPAIIFLLVEPYNKNSFVRFHAWQCIFLGIAAIAVQIILGIIPVIGWFILPFASLGILIVWIIAFMKALKGERYELPIIGKFAAQQAGA
jgi:uncharacterized membrane protein